MLSSSRLKLSIIMFNENKYLKKKKKFIILLKKAFENTIFKVIQAILTFYDFMIYHNKVKI